MAINRTNRTEEVVEVVVEEEEQEEFVYLFIFIFIYTCVHILRWMYVYILYNIHMLILFKIENTQTHMCTHTQINEYHMVLILGNTYTLN